MAWRETRFGVVAAHLAASCERNAKDFMAFARIVAKIMRCRRSCAGAVLQQRLIYEDSFRRRTELPMRSHYKGFAAFSLMNGPMMCMRFFD
jgi:hypothetical protein